MNPLGTSKLFVRTGGQILPTPGGQSESYFLSRAALKKNSATRDRLSFVVARRGSRHDCRLLNTNLCARQTKFFLRHGTRSHPACVTLAAMEFVIAYAEIGYAQIKHRTYPFLCIVYRGGPISVCQANQHCSFSAIPAAVICLVANTPPVPFGPVGVPTSMMISVTKINEGVMTRAIGSDMCLMALIIPVFMLVVLSGWKKAIEVLPAAAVVGISYAGTCFLVCHHVGVELPAILSSFASIVALIVFLQFWKPKTIWRFPNDPPVSSATDTTYTGRQIMKAWSSFVVLMIIMGVWGIPAFKSWVLNTRHWLVAIPHWPFLDGVVYRTAPIVSTPAKYAASYRWEFFTAAGTAMLISSLISMVILHISPQRGVKVFGKTCKQLAFALVTLSSVIGIAFLANYSGMSFTLGLAFAHYTGKAFPAVSPVIGWLGVFLTGSVTSSAALFGKLQQVTAIQIGVNPVLTTSANLFGGVMGKLISPQSIAVACAATGLIGRETDIFRKTLKYSVMLLALVIVVVLLQAYVVPWVVPTDVVTVAQQ